METPRNNLHRRLRRTLQRSARAELGAHARGLPGIVLAVRPDETRGVGQAPAFGVLVDLVYVVVGREGGAVGEAVGGGEPEGALALPVGGVDEARYDCWAIGGRAVLPVAEGLVTEH